MSNLYFWYVLYTKPRWEKKVAEILSNKNIETYCPVSKVQRQWHDRKKIIHEPLFTSYVFVQASVIQHGIIRQAPGVLNFVHWLGKPAIVRNEEIEAIKRFLNDYEYVQLERTAVNLHDRVRITHGPLMNREGNIVEIMHHTVKVILPSLGYQLVAQIQKEHVQRLEIV